MDGMDGFGCVGHDQSVGNKRILPYYKEEKGLSMSDLYIMERMAFPTAWTLPKTVQTVHN